MTLQIVQDEAADEVLSTNAFALLCGMLLYQQAPVDVAFAGPAKILDRFGTLDPVAIGEAPPEEFAELCATEPAVHPYPESMSVLIQALARFVVVNYSADTAAVWRTAGSGEHLLSRLTLMPGFSKRMAQMFVALLGRQLDVRPPGWEKAAGAFAQTGSFRSVADIHDQDSLDRVLNVKTGRRRGDREAGDGRTADRRSAPTRESAGLMNATTEDSPASPADDMSDDTLDGTTDGNAGDDEQKAARKAARRAARKAQRREARQAGGSAGLVDDDSDDSGDGQQRSDDGDGEAGEGADVGGEKLTPEQRAERQARKAAKRAARREAAGKDPEAEGSRVGGRRGGGRRGGGGGGGGRKRAETAAPVDSGADTETTPVLETPGDDV
ncbi:MAG: HhH-GPD-type base excision DNA repair protein [Nocardioidaceae bacterium]